MWTVLTGHEKKLKENKHTKLSVISFHPLQFLSMGPAQREAVWRALKDDAEKLLVESSGSPDRDSRRLKEELAECQQIFNRLSAEAAARGMVVCHLSSVFPLEERESPPPHPNTHTYINSNSNGSLLMSMQLSFTKFLWKKKTPCL